jgi:hypothetical protein
MMPVATIMEDQLERDVSMLRVVNLNSE